MNEKRIAEGEKTFLQKYYLLLFYSFFLLLDCWFLYKGEYDNRRYSKTLLMPCLLLWFMSNTAFNMRSSPYTLGARLLLYAVITVTWIADCLGLMSNVFMWSACLFLYTVSYFFYAMILLSIQKIAFSESGFVIYVKRVFPTVIIFLGLSALYLYTITGFGNDLMYITLYVHIFVIAMLLFFISNLWGVSSVKSVTILFGLSVIFLIITNAIYGVDEIIYHRKHRILDDGVCINNGLSQVLMILGVIKFTRIQKR